MIYKLAVERLQAKIKQLTAPPKKGGAGGRATKGATSSTRTRGKGPRTRK